MTPDVVAPELAARMLAKCMAEQDDPDFQIEPDSCNAVRPGPHHGFLMAPRCGRWVGHTEVYPHDLHEYSGSPSGAILWPVSDKEAREERFTAARQEHGLAPVATQMTADPTKASTR